MKFTRVTARLLRSMKETITDEDVSINRKFLASYEPENFIHVFACSNSIKALKLPDSDRRWLVPEVGRRDQMGRQRNGLGSIFGCRGRVANC